MRNSIFVVLSFFLIVACSKPENDQPVEVNTSGINVSVSSEIPGKKLNSQLPTVGVLVFEGFLTNEVTAPLDVFSKTDVNEKALFNVVLIAKENKVYISEEGLKVLPDFTLEEVPSLDVLVVPSSFHPEKQVQDKVLVNFLKEQNKTTEYIASHCAGAFLLGESGVADQKEIVTYVTGGEALQKDYPNLKVQDDSKISVVEDGKIISSNGSLVSYLASLDLLEKMTSSSHRSYVEEHLLLDRLVSRK
ncbi:DJ-1/PfpI family protein [Rapidithrix thailandica]|uniref:DJ-1/PfpI family protein n=1 Tax=Rapidithrix thailandica TaxID=413964 RepID=A0AAW9S8C2_9BACT